MSEFVMDDADKSRLEDKARADALAGVYVTPFDLINGSAKDKERKTEENRVYAVAHGAGKAEVVAEPLSLAEQCEAKFGKKPHHKMLPATIQAAIDEG